MHCGQILQILAEVKQPQPHLNPGNANILGTFGPETQALVTSANAMHWCNDLKSYKYKMMEIYHICDLAATLLLSAKATSDIHVSLAPTDKHNKALRMDVYEVSQILFKRFIFKLLFLFTTFPDNYWRVGEQHVSDQAWNARTEYQRVCSGEILL